MTKGRRRMSRPSHHPAFYGLSAQRIAEVCGVSQRTARRYIAGTLKPSLQVLRLVTLYREGRVLEGAAWKRFLVRADKLIDPAGYVFTPAVLEGYSMLLQWAHGMAAELGRTDEYYNRYLKVIEDAIRQRA